MFWCYLASIVFLPGILTGNLNDSASETQQPPQFPVLSSTAFPGSPEWNAYFADFQAKMAQYQQQAQACAHQQQAQAYAHQQQAQAYARQQQAL